MGITLNLACTGIFYALRFRRRVMLFENHLPTRSGLEQALLPRKDQILPVVREKPFYYDYQGMEQLLKILRAGYEPKALDRMAVSLLNGYLHYLPLSGPMNSDVYEYELGNVIDKLLWELERRNDLVLIDTQSSGNLTTKVILDQADLVVVNVRQDPVQIEQLLEQYGGLQDKMMFLISQYQEDSLCNRSYLSQHYRIPEEKIWSMPEYPLLPYLQDQGKLADFLQRNLWATSKEKNFALIRELRKTVGALYTLEKGGGVLT